MPVSWDMASGPTVTYNMAGQGRTCVAVEGSKGSNFSNFRMQDAMSRGLSTNGEAPKGSNYRFTSSHDTVVRGLSTLSLCGQYQLDADSAAEESRNGSLVTFRCVSPESYRCMSPRGDVSLPIALAPPVCGKPLGLGSPGCNVDFVQCNGTHSQASFDKSGNDIFSHLDVPDRIPLNSAYHTSLPNGNCCGDQGLPQDHLHSPCNTFKSSNIPESSLRMDGFDLDAISESSFSSETDMAVVSSSSGEASQGSEDTEVQSAYKEGGDVSCSLGSSISPRKGLSRFYAGKSRSFSCLTDVVSVKDLAKPESPYAKKRKVNSNSSRLPPLQKGSSTISKKPLQSGKSTLALAVAMSTTEENESQVSHASPLCQKSLVPSRSYSLSDLQGAARRSLLFIGRGQVSDSYA